MVQTLSLDEIAHVIALATAPAFLLGGIVAFLSLLTGAWHASWTGFGLSTTLTIKISVGLT
jgi:hypothetical protein